MQRRDAARRLVLPYLILAGTALAAPGELDLTFGGTGKALATFGQGTDEARAAAVQADGKLVVAGARTDSPSDEILLVRYDTDDSLDPSFGDAGEVRTRVPGYTSAWGFAMAIQPDDKIVVGGRGNGVSSTDFLVLRYDTNGALDPSFGGGDGIATVDFSGSYDECWAIAVQADGAILAAGRSSGAVSGFGVARLTSAGSLDTSFDGDGKTITALSSGATARGIAIQSNGRIVVAGTSNGQFVVVRYQTNGALDTSLDGDGLVFTSIFGTTSCDARAVAVQPAYDSQPERIVVAGRGVHSVSGVGYFAAARYDLSGALDPTFNTNGMVIASVPGSTDNGANAVLVQGGEITVAGYSSYGGGTNVALARFLSNGTLDGSFDGDGRLATVVSLWDDAANAITLQAGKIVVAGRSWSGPNNQDFAILRYATDGSLDATLDGDGIKLEDVGDRNATLWDTAIQPDGKILVFGSIDTEPHDTWALARYDADGTLDPSFGSGGKVVPSFSGGPAAALALQPDGRIVVVGTYYNISSFDFSVWRFEGDGSPDPTFGGNDLVTTTIPSGSAFVQAVALQPDGKIVVAGTSYGPTDADIALVRYNADGSLDTSFDGDGIATATVATGDDIPLEVKIQTDGKIVVCGAAEIAGAFDVALVRFLSNGSLDNSFGSFGRVATAMGSGSNDVAYSMQIQPDGKIVVAGYSNAAGDYDLAVLRYNANGSLDASFDGDGKVLTPVGLTDDVGVACALQADGKLVVAGYAVIGSNTEFAIARYGPDGVLDAGYGFGGKAVVDFDGGQDVAYAIAVDASGRAVVAGTSANRFGVARLQGDATTVGVASAVPHPPPAGSRIESVFPNPALGRQALVVRLAPGRPGKSLSIYSVDGRRVWTRDLSQLPAGTHRLEWNGQEIRGRAVAPGVYFARLEGAPLHEAVRLVRVR